MICKQTDCLFIGFATGNSSNKTSKDFIAYIYILYGIVCGLFKIKAKATILTDM